MWWLSAKVMRDLPSRRLKAPGRSRMARAAVALLIFTLPFPAYALSGAADAMIDIVIQAADPGLAPAKPMVICMAEGGSLNDCAEKQLGILSDTEKQQLGQTATAAKQEALKQLPFDPYDSRIKEIFDILGLVQKNDWLGVIDRAGSVAAKTMVCALMPPGVKTIGCPVTGYVIDHQKKVLATGYAALVNSDWPGLANLLLQEFGPDAVCSLLPSDQFGYLGTLKDIGCSIIGEILTAAYEFAKSVVALGTQGADALEKAFLGDDSHMPYPKYFDLYWQPWYHYGASVCLTNEGCKGLGKLKDSISGPCVNYFDTHNQYRDTAKKTCGDMYSKFLRQVKEFAARMKIEAEVHVDALWPLIQVLAVEDYLRDQMQPRTFFQLNCETQLKKEFPFAQPSEYSCELIWATAGRVSLLGGSEKWKPFFEHMYTQCLASVHKQWPSPTAWSAACAPAADTFETLFKQEKEYLGKRLNELVQGGCQKTLGQAGKHGLRLNCSNYPVYQACLAILNHGAEQQHCLLDRAAADQQIIKALMAQLGNKRCSVSEIHVVCTRPWKIDICNATRSLLLGASEPLSQVQCQGNSTALAAFAVNSKHAENIIGILNGLETQQRESPSGPGGRLEMRTVAVGRFCKRAWDPLAIDCTSKEPFKAHPEITLAACPPDPNLDGADEVCLVPRLYISDAEGQLEKAPPKETFVVPPGSGQETTGGKALRKPPATEVFAPPRSEGKLVDICLNWGSGCGKPAADAFCQKAGFARATEFTVANDIGAQEPTLVMGDGKLCTEAFCDGFAMIQCAH